MRMPAMPQGMATIGQGGEERPDDPGHQTRLGLRPRATARNANRRTGA
jgi:hypothetical protein